jgi:signal transduction histidine kinase
VSQAVSLTRRLRVVTAVAATFVVVSVLAVTLILRAADRAINEQARVLGPALQSSSQLLTALVDQETGLRGYALGRDPTFLEPFEQGRAREAVLRQRLETLLPARDLADVTSSIDRWRTEYQTPRLAGLRAGTDTADVLDGKRLFDRIRSAFADLNRTLTARQAATQDRERHLTGLVASVLTAVALAVLVALVLLRVGLRRWVVDPLVDLRRQVRAVAGGDLDTPLTPQGPPELFELGEDMEAMRTGIAAALQELESSQREIEQRSLELSRSNADLEQFAYVASHDLQEPLRKVASFCQLLEKRYGDQLDERGVQYIDFAVDGAKRMQRLINDLLTFSRVGRNVDGFVEVPLRPLVERAWSTLDARVEDVGGELEIVGDDLVALGDASLLELLLQNLLANGVKYRAPDRPPRLRVTLREVDDVVEVQVADNGIGIPAEYADKVFVIFQRLHGRDEYEGTGIGLALCKKVVEFHGGHIELTSSPLGGACVSFTVPAPARQDEPEIPQPLETSTR